MLLVAVVAASILTLSQVEASAIMEWAIPTASSLPYGIFVDGGFVYFTEARGNKIGRLSGIGAGTTTYTDLIVSSASTSGLALAVIGIGAGVAAAAVGLVVGLSQPRSEVYAHAGYYYCRRHRTPVLSVDGRLWCPVEGRFLRS